MSQTLNVDIWTCGSSSEIGGSLERKLRWHLDVVFGSVFSAIGFGMAARCESCSADFLAGIALCGLCGEDFVAGAALLEGFEVQTSWLAKHVVNLECRFRGILRCRIRGARPMCSYMAEKIMPRAQRW